MTTIATFVQGGERDRELFGLVGHWLCDGDLHKALGQAITSGPGDLWHVAIGGDGNPIGFCLVHLLRSRPLAHVRFLHGSVAPAATRKSVLSAAIAEARVRGMAGIYTYDRRTAQTWAGAKFKRVKRRGRSSFYRWERNLEAT